MCLEKFQQAEYLPFNQFSDPKKPAFHGKEGGFVAESASPPYIWIHLNPTTMKNFVVSLMMSCWLLPQLVLAQRFENSYDQPGTDNGRDVIELSDGTYVIAGITNSYSYGGNDMIVTKTSAAGAILWSKNFGGPGDDGGKVIFSGPNDDIFVGGYTTNGTNKEGFLVKLTTNGAVIWSKTFGGALSDEFTGGGYKLGKVYLCGNTSSAGAGNSDIWFLKTDTAGTIIQNKTLGTTGSEVANRLTFTSDNNIAVAGRTSGFGTNTVYVAKFNLSGDSLWTRNYDLSNSTNTNYVPEAFGITELSNQQLLITGQGWDVGNYPSTFHLRLDLNGATVYTKWTTLLSDLGTDVCAGKNGSYYLVISTCNFGCRIVLKKFDINGTETLYTGYQYPGGNSYANFAYPYRVKSISNSRLLITGNSELKNSNQDIYLAKLDSNGVAYTTNAPAITYTGSLSFCQGGSVLLKVPSGYTRYSWGRTNQNQLTYMNVDNDSLTVTTSGSYFCTMWNSAGMRLTAMVTVNVTANPTATITAATSANFCANGTDSVKLTATAGFTTYQWKLNGSNISGATTNIYYAKTSGTYSVQITNACGTSTTSGFNVNANYVPTPTIFCSGDCYASTGTNCISPGMIYTDNFAGVSYLWTVNGSPYFAGGNSLTPPYPPGTYECTVTNVCGSSTSWSYYVSSNPQTGGVGDEINYTGKANGCGTGSSLYMEAPFGSTGPYVWMLNSIPIPGATGSSYTATQSGSYYLSFYNPYCFQTITTQGLVVTLNTVAPVLSAPNGTSSCSGSVLLSVSPSGTAGMMYEWYKDYTIISGANTSNYSPTQSGRYRSRTYNPSCGWEFTNWIEVTINTPSPVVTSSAGQICSANIAYFNCSPIAPTLYTYQWFRNGSPISGANTANYSTNVSGTYHCTMTNSCTTATSNSQVLNVIASPTASIVPPPITTICSPGTITLNAVTQPGATYQWYNNNSLLSGATNPSYTAGTAGNYKVVVTANSCSATSSFVNLTAGTGPSTTITSTGFPQICSGETYQLKAPSVSGYTYQWRKNNVNISGATDSIYGATTSGAYTVQVTNVCGSLVSTALNLVVKAKPTATITPSGPLSFCAGDSVVLQASTGSGYTYLWKRNSNMIAGAVASTYTAKTAGFYKAGITSAFGCYKESSGLTVTVPCREDSSFTWENAVSVYPNPSGNEFEVTIQTNSNQQILSVACFDLQGREVSFNWTPINENRYLLDGLTPGVYLLHINGAEINVTKKIIKL